VLNESTRKNRAWIAAHLPHRGSMCLLDEVLGWNDDQVRCLTRSHRALDNPLRARGRLAAVCGIEFAAQAIAIHAALLAPDLPVAGRTGYLAAVRRVVLNRAWLDDIGEDLIASADRIGGDESSLLYDFQLSAGSRSLIGGRAALIINPPAAGIAPSEMNS
jgi:predicted hotdog family 3-hydroxylacyl-ACP dehydratase